jgi:predicted DNA-binding transcriptional regulator AlpA
MLAQKVDIMNREGYRVYVWEDPRDPDELPRWVGYGPWPTPWQSLWDFREHGTGPLFDWLRELDANGLQPKVSKFWALGRVAGCVDGVSARMVAREFIMQISRMADGNREHGPNYPPHPEFLLNPRLGTPDPRKPIIAERPEGQTMEFLSVGHAVECGYSRSAIYRALKRGGTHRGLHWRYAAGLKRGRINRPVELVAADGKPTRYASIYAAAKATGLSRPTIARMIEAGQPDVDDCRWRLAAD